MGLHTLVVYEEERLFLEGGSVSCGRDYTMGLYRVILCVWRIERECLLCWYECDVSNRERICGRKI